MNTKKNYNSGVISAHQIYPLFTSFRRNTLDKSWYIVKLNSKDGNKYQLFNNGVFIGRQYNAMEEVIDESITHSNLMCSAIKVELEDGDIGYICPTDKDQIIVETSSQAHILGSFLNQANAQVQKYIDTLQNGYGLENKRIDLNETYASRIKQISVGSTYEDGYVCSPIDMSVDLSKYDTSTCNMLSDTFYRLLSQYEWQIRDNATMDDDLKKAMLIGILPSWEYVTIDDLTAINERNLQNCSKNQNNSTIEDLSINANSQPDR